MSSITDDSDPKKNRFFKDIMAFHDRIIEDFISIGEFKNKYCVS